MKNLKRYLSLLLCMMMLLSLLPAGASAKLEEKIKISSVTIDFARPAAGDAVNLEGITADVAEVKQDPNNAPKISPNDKEYQAGKPYVITLNLKAKGNAEFADSLTVTAGSGVTVNVTDQKKKDATVTLTFTIPEDTTPATYNITVSANPTAGGNVTGGGTYNEGTTAKLTATPAEGYHFVKWTESQQPDVTTNPISFTVQGDRALTAHFELNQYEVTASVSSAGGGTTTGTSTYTHGQSVTVTATPDEGYHFVNWTENGAEVSTEATYSFTATTSRALVANFEAITHEVTVTANPTEGGTVTGGGTYNAGTTVTVTATANAGYAFKNWTKNGEEVSTVASYSFTASEDCALVANFDKIVYSIIVEATPGGSASTGGTYNAGATATVTATANAGYTFKNWTENGDVVSTDASYTFTVTGDRTLVANFEEKTPEVERVTVKFNANGHGTDPEAQTIEKGSKATKPEDPTAEGWEFKGWFTKKQCGPKDAYDFTQPVEKNIELFAKWEEKTPTPPADGKHTVTFVTNGGSPVDEQTVEDGQCAEKPTNPTKAEGGEGHSFRFDGWYTDQKCTAAYDFETAVTADITLYAKWVKLHKLTFYADAGETVLLELIVEEGSVADLTGYNVTGTWYEMGHDGKPKKETFDPTEDFVKKCTKVIGGSIEKIIEYTVKFDANTGTGTMADMTFKSGEEKALTANAFTKVGYTFGGWSNGDATYSDSQTVSNLATTEGAVVTLTAKWNPVTYTVIFNPNGGSIPTRAAGDVTQTFTYDQKQALLDNPFVNQGYTFAGWNTAADGSGTSYDDKAEVQNLASEQGAEITLYAQWTPIEYTITYNLDGGALAAGETNPGSYTIESDAITLKNPTKAGYTFAGWTGTGLDAATTTVTIAKGSTGNREYTATWTPITYTVSFDANGHGTAPTAQTVNYGTKAIKPTDLTASGYTFGGWYTEAACTNAYDFDTAVTGNITLYAKWTKVAAPNPTTYTVTYDAGKGSGSMDEDTVVSGSQYTLLANKFKAPSGKTFKCWKINGKEYDPGEKITVTSDVTVTAVWKTKSTDDLDYVPASGDNGPIFLWALLMLSCAVAAVEFTVRRKRR